MRPLGDDAATVGTQVSAKLQSTGGSTVACFFRRRKKDFGFPFGNRLPHLSGAGFAHTVFCGSSHIHVQHQYFHRFAVKLMDSDFYCGVYLCHNISSH
jgi:hypothetical protein